MNRDGIARAMLFVVALQLACVVSAAAASESGQFLPLEHWKAAVIAGEPTGLKALYSVNPPAVITAPGKKGDANLEVAFWKGLKAQRLDLNILQLDSPQPGLRRVIFQAEVHSSSVPGGVLYLSEGQLWHEEKGKWLLIAVKRTDAGRLPQPASMDKEIYRDDVDAHAEIKNALQEASAQHKRVILVFGANWCYDCHVLDLAFHRPDFAAILDKNYVVVHVDIGRGDKNQDLMDKYEVPMKKGIPALAVLDSNGKLLFSQRQGEFENARALGPEDLLQFLNKWKP
jgi:Thioredoxin-like